MTEIKLFNRDGATLKLVKTDKVVDSNTWVWALEVDRPHDYIFEYSRVIYSDNNFSRIQAIDPSGGPFISVGDTFEKHYKIIRINSIYNIWISEGNNN